MDIIDRLKDLNDRFLKLKDGIETEEATKNAFIMPFISVLGYDVFNPTEVVPEFTADIGTKKGEKVDYCIFHDNKPTIIIEAKHWKEKLDAHHSQLHRYFHVSEAKFAILTNGIQYKFYSDLEEKNIMDKLPFFEFTLDKVSDNDVNELKKFQKETFDVDTILSNASDMKYAKGIKEALKSELDSPSSDFVKFLTTKVYEGRITGKIIDQFEGIVQKSIKSLMNEMINNRLSLALGTEETETVEPIEDATQSEKEEMVDDNGIVTTEEELEGFRIIQAIVRKSVSLERIHKRDTKSYFGILLDDNNRKPICRLWFNGGKKHLGLFDENKQETKHHIEKLEEIYQYEDAIRKVIESYG